MVELPSSGRYGCKPVPVPVVVVEVAVDVAVWAVVVDVTVDVACPTEDGLTVTTTVVTTVEGDVPASTVVEVEVRVMAVTELATHPICAHLNPEMQHPPPTSAAQDVLPLPHSPTLPPQVCPSGQHPTFPESGLSTT